MKAFALLLLFIHSILLSISYALDVSWIPTNPDDGPLPLSTKYRDNLRKLCMLLKSPRPPPELQEKRLSLQKMCKRLASDDANVKSSSSIVMGGSKSMIIVGLIGFGLSYYAWENRRYLVRMVKHWYRDIARHVFEHTGSHRGIDINRMEEINQQAAREARLKRFDEKNEPPVIDKLD